MSAALDELKALTQSLPRLFRRRLLPLVEQAKAEQRARDAEVWEQGYAARAMEPYSHTGSFEPAVNPYLKGS